MSILRHEMAAKIDHTLLKAETTAHQIEKLCQEAIEYQFAAVCIQPIFVPLAVSLLKGQASRVATVVGFPLGANSTKTKIFETELAIAEGANEIDMVISVGKLLSGDSKFVENEIKKIVKAANQIPVKVILENAYLSRDQKIQVCEFSRDAGAAFVKTSTGFAATGATIDDVQLMHKAAGPKVEVKASGGVRTLSNALQMIEAGASRIGTSSGVSILKELP